MGHTPTGKLGQKRNRLHLSSPYVGVVSPLLAYSIDCCVIRGDCVGGNLSWADLSMHHERTLETHRRQRVVGCGCGGSGCIGERRRGNCSIHDWVIGSK